jgi:hypothetical protein
MSFHYCLHCHMAADEAKLCAGLSLSVIVEF